MNVIEVGGGVAGGEEGSVFEDEIEILLTGRRRSEWVVLRTRRGDGSGTSPYSFSLHSLSFGTSQSE